MELPALTSPLHRWILICIFLPGLPLVRAESAGVSIGLVVGLSILTSLITAGVTTLGVLFCARRYTNKKKLITRDPSVRASILSSDVGSMRSDESVQPLTGRYVRQQSNVSGISCVNGDLRKSRVKSDFIAKWCTEHTLTEKTAEVLREHGFTYRQAVEAMDVNDVSKLGLTKAQECLLRQVLNIRQRNSSASSMHQVTRAISDEAIPLTSISHNTSGGSSGGGFERTQSMDHVDGQVNKPLQASILKRSRRSMGSSMEIIEDREPRHGGDTIIIHSNNTVVQDATPNMRSAPPPSVNHKNNNSKRFNGLLSDKGLWQLARMIGVEWTRLATYLDVPSSVQAQIKLDNPNNTLAQINKVLMVWRDTCPGSKQHVKGVLYNALCKCDRSDLGEDILREETHGSEEKVSYQSIL